MTKIQFTLASFSLAFLCIVTGCETKTADRETPWTTNSHDRGDDGSDSHSHDHDVAGHAHGPGPHEGTVADWGGGKFHVEFTVDHDKQEATVYVFGGDEKTVVPIDASEIMLTITEPSLSASLKAAPQDGDPAGKASRFVGAHEGLGVVREYEGSMSGVVEGTPYSGNFKEEAHEHE